MAHQGLREFLERLEQAGELHRIRVEVDPVLEIAAITARQKAVARGACQEVVETVPDLAALPALKSWPGDGLPANDGRFIRLPLVFTRDPDTSAANWLGIGATRKLAGEGLAVEWPQEFAMDEAVRKLVTKRWREYGF